MHKFLLAALITGAALIAYGFDLHHRLEPEALRGMIADSGAWGPVLFVALFSLLEAFGVPGLLFMLTAVLVWPLWMAFLLNLAGAVGAGTVGFVFARTFGREWVAGRLPEPMRRLEKRVEKNGFMTVVWFRLLFFLAFPAHWALGLSPVRFPVFLIGSVVGFVPGIAATTFLGDGAVTWLRGQPFETWITGVALLLLVFLIWKVSSRRRAVSRVT